jgi:chromosome segregation ATPase
MRKSRKIILILAIGILFSTCTTTEGQGGISRNIGYTKVIESLQERNAALEEQVTGLSKAVVVSSAEGSVLSRQLNDLQDHTSVLQEQVVELNMNLTESRVEIRTLISQNADQAMIIQSLNSRLVVAEELLRESPDYERIATEISEREAVIQSLNTRLTTIRQILQGDRW